MDLFLFITLLLCSPLIETSYTDCNGKSFHCVNSTHFLFCVDVGGGVSMTISSFVLPCPPTTFCLETNSFECEYRIPSTQKPILLKSDVAHELNEINTTTSAYGDHVSEINSLKTENIFVLPLQKYYTNEILEDTTTNTIPPSSLRSSVNNGTVNNNGNNRKDNMNNIMKFEMAIDLNNTNRSKLQSLTYTPEFEKVMNKEAEVVDVGTKVKLTHGNFTTRLFPSELNSNLSSPVTTLKSIDYYNSEKFTENNVIINFTENSTTDNFITAVESNLFTDVPKNSNSIITEVTKKTPEIINISFNDSQHVNSSYTDFISNMYFTNGSLLEPRTMTFPINFSFINEEINNNATNKEDNVQLNMVSANKDAFKTSQNVYGTAEQVLTTDHVQSLTQNNSYTTTMKRKQSVNATNKIYQGSDFMATTDLTSINTKSLQEKLITDPDQLEIKSTPFPEICRQNGNIICLENNDTLNIIKESTKITTIETTLSGFEGIGDVTTPTLLNTDEDNFTLYDVTASATPTNSIDDSSLLRSFTNATSKYKLYDVFPTYSFNTTTLKPYTQQSNGSSIKEISKANTKIKLINNSLATESVPAVQVLSGFESTVTKLQPVDSFLSKGIKQKISNINVTNNETTKDLKIGKSEVINRSKTKIFDTETEHKTIKRNITGITDKALNNIQNDFTDKMFTSDRFILNDNLVTNMTLVSYISFSNVTTTNVVLLNNTQTNEEHNTQPNNFSVNVDDFTTERFRSLEVTYNDEKILKNTKPENITTILPSNIILHTTTPNTIKTTYFKTSFQDDVVMSQPKHEHKTFSNLISNISDQNNITAIVHLRNSGYLLESSTNLITKNYSLHNITINSSTKNKSNENATSDNKLLNFDMNIKINNITLKENSNNVIENPVIFTDISDLKINKNSTHTTLDSILKLNMTTDFSYKNNTLSLGNNIYGPDNKLGINLQKVKSSFINTIPNSNIKFGDLETTTFISIANNNNHNKNVVTIIKPVFVENISSGNNQASLNITVIDKYELTDDNVTLYNSMSKDLREKLIIKQVENQNVPQNNDKQSLVHLTHEKIVKDLREYKPVNEQTDDEFVLGTPVHNMKNYTSSTPDVMRETYKNFEAIYDKGNVITLNVNKPFTISSFDTSTITNENKQDVILSNLEENGKEILRNNVFTLSKNTTDTAKDIVYTEVGSLNENIYVSNDKNNSLYRKLNNSDRNPQSLYNLTQALPVYTMVNKVQQKHLSSVITNTDKTFFSSEVKKAEKVHEAATSVINIVHEVNTAKNKLNEDDRIVLNSSLKNLTQVSSVVERDNKTLRDKNDKRYILVESNQDILSKTKDLGYTETILITNGFNNISNNNTDILKEQISKPFKYSDSLHTMGLKYMQQSNIPDNNITGIRTRIQKDYEFLQMTATPKSNQLNLQSLNKTAGTDTKTMQNMEQKLIVTSSFKKFRDSQNDTLLMSVVYNKELKQNWSNYQTIQKLTTDNNLSTDMLPTEINIRTSNNETESRLMTNDIKQAINNNKAVNNSRSQVVYDNNNKASNLSETKTFNNFSLKFPHVGIKNSEKKTITNSNLLKGLFLLYSPLLKNLSMLYGVESSTETPNSLKFPSYIENNQTHELLNVGRKIELHGSEKIKITANSNIGINKNELMRNKNTTKYLTTSFKFSNTTNNSKMNYYNNNNLIHKATDTHTLEMPTYVFHCKNNFHGKFADKNNCRKFYICIGESIAIIGLCPINTVFSDFRKQCTNNLSHCVRNYQFQCTSEGRFGDVTQDNIYYICIKGLSHNFTRFKFQCQKGYSFHNHDMICKKTEQFLNSLSSSNDVLKNKKVEYDNASNKKINFKCEEEGKFADPYNRRRYYICSKTSKSILRRRRKKCDSDEVFDNDKNKCVDKDSHEYS